MSAAAIRSGVPGSVTSAASVSTSPSTERAASRSFSSSRDTMSTLAPSAASMRAVASPMPLLAPVTTALRPLISRSMREMISAHVAAGGRLGGGAVAPAEQDGVHEQREQLPQADAVLVAVCERCDLLVRGEHALARGAEQPQHGEVDLAVTAVRSRVDQPRAAVRTGQHVAAPQVSVQPRRRLGGAPPGGDPPAPAPREPP